MSLKQQVIDLILTHPEDFIMMKEIKEQLPNANPQSVAVCVAKTLKWEGYIEVAHKVKTPGIPGDGPAVYKILTREQLPYKPTPYEATTKRTKKPKKPKLVTKPVKQMPVEMSMAEVGERIVAHIDELRAEVRRLRDTNNDLMSEYNKEKAADKLVISGLKKEIKEQDKIIQTLRSKIKRDSGRTFTLGEQAAFRTGI
jgi:hypothetical protein